MYIFTLFQSHSAIHIFIQYLNSGCKTTSLSNTVHKLSFQKNVQYTFLVNALFLLNQCQVFTTSTPACLLD